ncbi:hypothetical protein BCR34DRAFT_569220 [Clohesyomyces aquaticus]|uniref:Uncharacterized protein n=1 Tax=Clohesyomyces aquaticus TaxID=1231657 RepID=A0A1Y1ZF96_9PLEO|nr:hypothetical protein BCR34DRAFT_569220 [Clohesyomyces aquaticus]
MRLPDAGMPTDRFKLVLEGRSEETVQVWETLKEAAAMQNAIVKCLHQQDKAAPPLYRDEFFQERQFSLPLYLPSTFSQSIKAIVHGDSFSEV